MCGITGYIGYRNASEVLIDCLKRLEYRGYDSAGIGVIGKKLSVFKEVGEIKNIEKEMPEMDGNVGIGHTRWATHGKVSKENAHPHLSCNKKIALVHNGIIEDFKILRGELEEKNHKFYSETDSEVIIHLIEEEYSDNLENAVLSAIKKLKGSYALVVISQDEPDRIIAARKESPLVIGVGDNENFVASDVPAFLKYTNRAIYLDDNEICILKNNSVKIINQNGKKFFREEKMVNWSIGSAEKSGYPHFMLKEIHEQPSSISNVLMERISEIDPWVNLEGMDIVDICDINSITIVACGTSFYAGMIGKYIIEKLASISVTVELSSEYRYFGKKGGMVVAITQSGETADTLGAVKEAKKYGCKTVAITNVAGSSITRIADISILTRCGPEMGVAATKTFTSQIVALFLLALKIGIKNGSLNENDLSEYASHLRNLPSCVKKVLDGKDKIKKIAERLKEYEDVFFIGRGINYPLALEGALKLKEISYIHAEGFAAGELKHGPFALLTEKTPIIAIVTKDIAYEKILSNIGEIKARNSPVIAIADENDEEIETYADFVIRFPSLPDLISCIPIAVTLQLLAYYVANFRECSIDKPRNLAKSVTVE